MRDPHVIEIPLAEWSQTVVDFSDHNYEQSSDYTLAMAEKTGSVARFLLVKDAGRAIGAAAVRIKRIPLIGRGVAYISGGPLVCPRGAGSSYRDVVLVSIKRKLVDEEGHALYLRLPLAREYAEAEPINLRKLAIRPTARVRSYTTILVDIGKDAERLRAGLVGKWRTHLRYAERAGLSIDEGRGPAFNDRFMAMFGEMHDAKNFDVKVDPRFFFALPPDSIGLSVMIARDGNQDVAGHVTSRLGDTAVYLFGATSERGRTSKAGYHLMWQSIMRAKEHGCSFFDLGGIDMDANPGVTHFKKRVGGLEVTAPGPFVALPGSAFGPMLDTLVGFRSRLKANSP